MIWNSKLATGTCDMYGATVRLKTFTTKGAGSKFFLQLKKFLRDAATHKDERKERSKFNQPRFSSKGIGVTAPFMLA